MDNINFNNKNINYIYNSVLDLCLKFLTLLRYDKNTYMDIWAWANEKFFAHLSPPIVFLVISILYGDFSLY